MEDVADTPAREVQFYSNDFAWEELVPAGEAIVAQQAGPADGAMREGFEERPAAFWDDFFGKHQAKFFKPRNYITACFPQLKQADSTDCPVVLDVGCGAGSTLVPMLRANAKLRVFGCDFSERAVECAREQTTFAADRCSIFRADITQDAPFASHVAERACMRACVPRMCLRMYAVGLLSTKC